MRGLPLFRTPPTGIDRLLFYDRVMDKRVFFFGLKGGERFLGIFCTGKGLFAEFVETLDALFGRFQEIFVKCARLT